MTVRIPLEATPDEEASFKKDAGWARVATLAVKKGFSPADWRTAMRAFRFYVDLAMKTGEMKKGSGLNADEVSAWFDAWYGMLQLRRLMRLQDRLSGMEDE